MLTYLSCLKQYPPVYYYSAREPLPEEAGFGVVLALLLVYFVCFAVAVTSYVLTSLSVYTIAKRRNLSNPFLAWIPCIGVWTLGAIADDYDVRTGGKLRNWRKVLLAISLISTVGVVFMTVFMIVVSFAIAVAGQSGQIAPAMIGSFVVTYVVFFVAVMLSTALSYLSIICLYKLFESTVYEKALKYTIISLVVPLGCPILLMMCRNKGYEGLPPDFYPMPSEQGYDNAPQYGVPTYPTTSSDAPVYDVPVPDAPPSDDANINQ